LIEENYLADNTTRSYGGMIMSSNPNVRGFDNPGEQHGGPVWHKLHSEREEVSELLLKEGASKYAAEAATGKVDQDAIQAENWRRELLQARLRKIDDALDRLMTGSYGNCSHCGRWIQDTKLEFDPAVAFCVECWERMQTKH
jgi:RNA polymerase-binding transcription factor